MDSELGKNFVTKQNANVYSGINPTTRTLSRAGCVLSAVSE